MVPDLVLFPAGTTWASVARKRARVLAAGSNIMTTTDNSPWFRRRNLAGGHKISGTSMASIPRPGFP